MAPRSARSSRDKSQTGQVEAEFLQEINPRECYLGCPVAEKAGFVVHQGVEQSQALQAESGGAKLPFRRVQQHVRRWSRHGVQ